MKSASSLLLIIGWMAPAIVVAQLSGTWDITASFQDPQQELSCGYSGTGMLTQMGNQVTGPISLTVDVNNDRRCPGDMVGQLIATVTGSDFTGTIDGANNPTGDVGQATIMGTITVPPPPAATKEAMMTTMTGSSNTTSGPFPGSTGTFGGTLQAMVSTARPLALAALALVLLGGGTLLLVRRAA